MVWEAYWWMSGYRARMGGVALRDCPLWLGIRNERVEEYAREWESGWRKADSDLSDEYFCAMTPRHGMY